MIILFSLALLFVFVNTSIGYWVRRKLVPDDEFQFSFLEILLIGVAAQIVYFNILSIFLPSDFRVLIPVLIASLLISFSTRFIAECKQHFKKNCSELLARENKFVTISLLAVIVLFTVVPPYNTDSSGYHFLSILWNEKFKAVPGLANLFPQYGYNTSFFVLSAPYSFTNLFHQSIYPINFVLVTAFFTWMLKKSFGFAFYKKLLMWVLLIIFLRQFPINLASPSADALTSILVFYILINIYEKRSYRWQANNWKVIILLSVFATIIKLSTLPLLLVILLPLFIYRSNYKSVLINYVKLLPLVLLIVVPWLIRNIILSGYLFFPLHSVDLFSFDWKVPANIVFAEKLHIAHAPRMISDDFMYANSLSFFKWFPIWLPKVWGDNHFNFLLVVAGLMSPLLVLFVYKKWNTIYPFSAWLVSYVSVWFWMFSSPDIRFGYHYLLPCIFFPLLTLAEGLTYKLNVKVVTYFICVICGYYLVMAVKMLLPYSLSQYLVCPLKSPEYYKNNDLKTFRYVMLDEHTKLYIHDSAHHSINAPLPSCSPYRTGIRMRGNKLSNGFKTVP